LFSEAKENAAEKDIPPAEYVEELWISRKPMLPDDFGGGSQRHYEVTLKTLNSLAKASKTHPDEPPPQPPDQ
jgi:hypothetical protein